MVSHMASVFPTYNAIHNGASAIFAKCTRGQSEDTPYTHLVLTGGMFSINDDDDLRKLYDNLGV